MVERPIMDITYFNAINDDQPNEISKTIDCGQNTDN
jgi:hypothetical protein